MPLHEPSQIELAQPQSLHVQESLHVVVLHHLNDLGYFERVNVQATHCEHARQFVRVRLHEVLQVAQILLPLVFEELLRGLEVTNFGEKHRQELLVALVVGVEFEAEAVNLAERIKTDLSQVRFTH